MSDELLTIYLRDHLAAATGGLHLAERARDAQEGRSADRHAFLTSLADEIAADRQQLRRCLDCVGARPDPVKIVAGALAERLGRLKRNGRLLRRSPLSDLVELEGLTIAVQGKRAGWIVLRDLAHPRLATINFGVLVDRAEHQSADIESRRRPLAAGLFGAD